MVQGHGFVLLGERNGVKILYLIEEDMVVHISKTCAVIRVIELGTERRLVLKFMHERSQYDTEIAMRQLKGAGDEQLSANCVVAIKDRCILPEQDLQTQADICSRRTGKANEIRNYGRHVLVNVAAPEGASEIHVWDLHAHQQVQRCAPARRIERRRLKVAHPPQLTRAPPPPRAGTADSGRRSL